MKLDNISRSVIVHPTSAVVQPRRRPPSRQDRCRTSDFPVDMELLASSHAQCGLVYHLTTVGLGWGGWTSHTRTPGSQSVGEAGTQGVVCPVVDDWVPTTAAHRSQKQHGDR